MSTFLGIDVGTSSVISVLIDEEQTVLAQTSAPLALQRPQHGWSEQDPDNWWQAVGSCLDAFKASHGRDLAAVEGIGLSGQMHGATLLDAADEPLRPCILWNDGRAAAECRLLEASCPRLGVLAGNLAMPGFTAPKLLWVRDHEAQLFSKIASVLLPKDYIRLLLTGDKASDMSDAAGTLWLDVAGRAWSDELLDATDLSRDHMPALVEGSATTGRLRSALCERWGMGKGPVVAGGGGDNAASACGLGAVRPGTGFVSIGTSGVLFVTNDRFSPNTADAIHTFCHAVPDTWHQMGVILSAAASLEWLASILGSDPPALVGELGEDLGGPAAPWFLPYLSGERTPHNDASVRGGFFGIDAGMDRQALTRAVLQGVAFAFQDSFQALSAAGASIERLYAAGGGSQSRLWLRMTATTMGLPIEVPAVSALGAAFGAARLGMTAATGNDPLAICGPPEICETIEPDAVHAPAYRDAWLRYRSLYPAMKEALSA